MTEQQNDAFLRFLWKRFRPFSEYREDMALPCIGIHQYKTAFKDFMRGAKP